MILLTNFRVHFVTTGWPSFSIPHFHVPTGEHGEFSQKMKIGMGRLIEWQQTCTFKPFVAGYHYTRRHSRGAKFGYLFIWKVYLAIPGLHLRRWVWSFSRR